MLHFAENHAAKPIFVVLSLFLILLTITLTVAQTRQSQDLQSAASTELKNCTIGTNASDNDQDEKKLLKLINDYRKEKNLVAYSFQEDLNRAAAWHSNDMAKRTKLDHKDSSGRMDTERIKDCGYSATIQQTVENVAEWPTPEKVFSEWKKSSGHNANMLCATCRDIGLAHDKGSDKNQYWTMDGGVQGASTVATATPTPKVDNSADPTATPTATTTPTQDDDTGDDDTVTDLPRSSVSPAPQTLPEGKTGVLLIVKLPGIGEGGNEDPRNPNREISLTVTDNTGKKIDEETGAVSYNQDAKLFTGAIELPKLASSAGYLVTVNMPYSITQTITSGFIALQKDSLVTLPEIYLPTIDFTKNNAIGVTDYFAFRNCIGAKSKSCNLPEMDVNDDGAIDVLDHNIIVEVFSTVEGQ